MLKYSLEYHLEEKTPEPAVCGVVRATIDDLNGNEVKSLYDRPRVSRLVKKWAMQRSYYTEGGLFSSLIMSDIHRCKSKARRRCRL